jgi:hypothetical protein
MHPYAEEMDLGGPDGGGEDLRVQRWYTGRGSLWRPPSNLARITRQETRLIKSAIQVRTLPSPRVLSDLFDARIAPPGSWQSSSRRRFTTPAIVHVMQK